MLTAKSSEVNVVTPGVRRKSPPWPIRACLNSLLAHPVASFIMRHKKVQFPSRLALGAPAQFPRSAANVLARALCYTCMRVFNIFMAACASFS